MEAELVEALRHLLISAVDLRNGYLDRDLHEPWTVTEERARTLLVRAGVNIDE